MLKEKEGESKTVIFTGPSLNSLEASSIFPGAIYKPPIRRGDAIKAYEEGAKVIAIIDGVFFDEVAVAPRELLYLLDKGVTVVGGGSIGALRAAELDIFGMIGVGEVYEMYKRGEIDSDDEVALIFNPYTFEPLSEPLVNIRFNLKKAVEIGLLEARVAQGILEVAKKMHYSQRSYVGVLRKTVEEGLIEEELYHSLSMYFANNAVDLKRLDAIKVVEKVKGLCRPTS
ncbi:MAG: TfuA-related McrA-glycine thioamidation protein [Candidatus Nezhaarchaeota archaeon]|nr:TfuA-related McrA-glycine thioamidation protein [Candidatus Nezhaarchaeota archaeon]